tara:strand:+ start:727 stop:1860 length:1134 start_codon:yes stop_codon:yes gene_type:complete
MSGKTLWFVLFSLFTWSGFAQTIVLIHPKGDHPLSQDFYLAGSFNNWNPADSNFRFEDGQLTIKLLADPVEAKITGGSWELAEAFTDGSPRPNRVLDLSADTIHLSWEAWEDHAEHPPRGLHLLPKNDSLLYNNAYRQIWIYLPEGYETARRDFPVMYFQDAQNLFRGLRGSSSKWNLAQCLDSLELPLIVVAINHGGENRIRELSPFENEEYGGGEGYEYLDFIVNQVKPYIDAHYPVKTQREYTYIGGSSLGGLISLTALEAWPDVFGGALVFSPAYWFNPEVPEMVAENGSLETTLIYQMIGTKEGNKSGEAVQRTLKCRAILDEMHPNWQIHTKVVADGEHNEDLWREQLPEALLWFFKQAPLKKYRHAGKKP